MQRTRKTNAVARDWIEREGDAEWERASERDKMKEKEESCGGQGVMCLFLVAACKHLINRGHERPEYIEEAFSASAHCQQGQRDTPPPRVFPTFFTHQL